MISKEEKELRNISLHIFNTLPNNRGTVIEMIMQQGSYRYNVSREPDYNSLMSVWELISKTKTNDPHPNELEEGEILIDEMTISGRGAIIKAFQMKDGEWVNLNDRDSNWYGITWMAYHMFIEGQPHASDTDSLKEAIWKTITDFTMFWCKENIKDFNIIFI